MATCLLFAYGMLKPELHPPRTLVRHMPDAVRGFLYDLGTYPGAVQVGTAPDWIEGQVLEIDESELASLDAFEEVDCGVYVRRQVLTRANRQVWIYEYRQPLPPGARRIASWPSVPPGTDTSPTSPSP